MKSRTKRIISTLAICGALVLEAGATAIGSLGKALNNIAKVDASGVGDSIYDSGSPSFGSGYACGNSTLNNVQWYCTTRGNNTCLGWNKSSQNKSADAVMGPISAITETTKYGMYMNASDFANAIKISVTFDNSDSVTGTWYIFGSTNSGTSWSTLSTGTLASSTTSIEYTATAKIGNTVRFGFGFGTSKTTGTRISISKIQVWEEGSGGETTTYSVDYLANTTDSVTGMPSKETGLSNGSHNLSTAKPSRSGYDFVGWNTDSTATTGITSVTISNADVNVYAIWKEQGGGESTSYTLVTDVSKLKNGLSFVLVGYASSTYRVNKGLNSGHIKMNIVTDKTSVSDGFNTGSVLTTSEADAFTLVKSDSNWEIKNGSDYLQFTGTSNGNDSFATSSGTNTKFTISSGSSNTISILSTTQSNRYLKYNTSTGDLRNGGSTYGNAIYMFAALEPEKNVSSIAIKTAPSKTTYYEGESFDPTGLVITATYDDESTADIAYADHAGDFSFSPSGNLATTDNKVTITYKEKTVDQQITVNSDTLNSITLGGSVTGTVSGGWDLSGVTVTGNYASGSRLITDATPTTSTPAPTEFKEYTVSVSVTYKGVTDNKDYTAKVEKTGLTPEEAFTAEEAIAKGTTGDTPVYVKDKVTKVDQCSAEYKNATFWFGDFELYRVKLDSSLGEMASDTIKVGQTVMVFGKITTYGSTVEIGTDGIIKSITNKQVSSIAVTTSPTNVQYSNKAFDKTGMVVTATYDDASTADVTNSVVIEPSTLASTTTSVTIKYTEGEKKVQTNLTVDVLTLNKITAEGQTTKFRDGDTFTFDGNVYPWYTHSSGATESKGSALASTEFTVSKSGKLTRGNAQEVVITHTASTKTCSYTIDVDYAYVASVSMESPIQLGIGGTATFSATVLPDNADQSVVYSIDEDQTTLDDSEYTLSGNVLTIADDIAESGEVYVIATTVGKDSDGQSKTTSCKVEVTKAVIAQIIDVEVTGSISQIEQYAGKDFNYDGLEFTPVWSEGDHGEVVITGDDIEWPALTNGMTSIKGQYDTGSSKLDVDVSGFTVVEDYLKSITIAGDMTNKTYYSNAKEWNFAGLAVTGKNASDDDATIVQENVTYEADLTPAEYLSTGAEKLVVTATYGEKTDTIDITGITINEYKLDKIEITTNPSKLSYILGEDYNAEGLVVKATYSDGTFDDNFDGYTLDDSAVNKFAAGTYAVKVKADGVTDASFNVTYTAVTPQPGYDYWQKVTSNQTDMSGEYLLAYEDTGNSKTLFWTGVDGGQCHVDVSTPSTGKLDEIPSGAVSFIVSKMDGGYSIKLNGGDKNGQYIGQDSYANGMKFTETEQLNTISIDGDGNAVICGSGNSSGTYVQMKYNKASGETNERFRYYKSGQQNVILYKNYKQEQIVADLIKLNVSCAKTFKEGDTLNISDLTISGLYNDGNTKDITSGVTFSDGTTSKVLEAGDNNLVVKCGEVTENITITATPLVKYNLNVTIDANQAEYTVTPALTDGKLIGGEDYTIEVSAKEGYIIESVTATGASVSGNIVTISNASGDVSITVTSRALASYDIAYNGTNADYATISPKPTSIVEGEDLDLTVTAKDNKKIDSVVVTMGGVEQTDAYSDGTIHLDDVSGDIVITVNCSYITYEVDFSGSDENITFDPATTTYNQGAEFEVTAIFNDFLFEIDEDNSTVSMEGGGEIVLIDNVIYTDEVTGKITVSIVLKDVTYTVNVADDVHYSVTSAVPQENNTLLVTLSTDEHYVLPEYIDGYEVSGNTISIPADDLEDRSITLTTPAVLAQHTVVCKENVGISGSIITSPVNYGTEVDYVFDVLPGFVNPTDANITMTDGISYNLSKKEDGHWHLTFTVTKDVEFSVVLTATIEYDLNNATSSNTDTTIEVGTAYTTTITLPAGYDPANTTIKVERYNAAGDLVEITGVVDDIVDNKAVISVPADKVTSGLVITATTELQEFTGTITGDNLLGEDAYATVVVYVNGEVCVLTGNTFTYTYGEKVGIAIVPSAHKEVGNPTVTLGGTTITEGYAWTHSGSVYSFTMDSVTDNLGFDCDVNKIVVSDITLDYDDETVTITSQPTTVYEGESCTYVFEIDTLKVAFGKYQFDKATSSVIVNGVDITNEEGVWKDESGILRIVISDPEASISITVGLKEIEYTITGNELENATVGGETYHLGDEYKEFTVSASEHYHFEGDLILEIMYPGTDYYTTLSLGADYTLLYDENKISVIIKIPEIQGNYRVAVPTVHDNVSATTGALSHITFDFTSDHENVPYQSQITGKFTPEFGYELPSKITVTSYGQTLVAGTDYLYNSSTGVFSIYAPGDIVISATSTQGKVNFSFVNTTEEGKATLETPLDSELDSGYTIENKILVPEGYVIENVVITMGGNVVKGFNPVDNSVYVFQISDDVVITVTTRPLNTYTVDASGEGLEHAITDWTEGTTVTEGKNASFTFTPATGYDIVVTATGATVSVNDGVYTVSVIGADSDVSITVNATAKEYSVIYNLEYVTSTEDVSVVSHGDSFTTTLEAVTGYTLDGGVIEVLVNGTPINVVDGVVTIESVTGPIVITARAVPTKVDVTFTLNNVATASNMPSKVDYDGSFTTTISALPGYENLVIKVNGVEWTSGSTITISPVQENIEIVVTASKVTCVVTDDTDAHITLTGASEVTYNESYVGTIVADEGYVIVDNVKVYMSTVPGGDELVDITSSCYFNGRISIPHVTGDVNVVANSDEKPGFSVSSTHEHATLTGDVDGEYGYLESYSVTVEANEGYNVSSIIVKIDGVSHPEFISGSNIVITKVSGDVEVIVTCEAIPQELNIEIDNASLPGLPSSIKYGDSINTKVEPNTGFDVISVKVYENGVEKPEYVIYHAPTKAVGSEGWYEIVIPAVKGNIKIEIESAPIEYSVDTSGLINVVSNGADEATFGEAYTAKLTPEVGYENIANIKVYMNGEDVTASVLFDNYIFITNVTGEISIEATASEMEYIVSHDLTNVSIDESEGTFVYSHVYEANVSYNEEGYIDFNITITVDGVDRTSDFYLDGKVTITAVKGNVVIKASASAKEFDVVNDLENVGNTNPDHTVHYDDSYYAELDVDEGYENLTVKVLMGGVDVTDEVYNDGVIDIDVVLGEIHIIAEASPKVFNISYYATNSTVVNPQTTAEYNSEYLTEVHANNGFENLQVTVLMGGVDVTDFAYEEGVVFIEQVTGDIVITASATPKHFAVTYDLDHVNSSSAVNDVTYGGTYETTLSLPEGYFNLTVKVTMNGEDVTADVYSGGNITILGITGPIEIKASSTAIVLESITAVPVSPEVNFDTELTVDDFAVTGHYNDGSTKTIAADSISGYDPRHVGEQVVVVSASGKTCETTVVVKASEVIVGIEATTQKTEVQYGGTFTKDDVKASYVYSDGHKSEAVVDSIEGFNPTQFGKQTITVHVGDYTTTLEITVTGKVVVSIEAVGYTNSVDQGKDYNFDGKVIAHYNDDTSEEVSGYVVDKVDTSNSGAKTVKVTYEGISTEITINVIQTKTPIDAVQAVAIGGGCVVGVSILAVGLYYLLKMFKL